MQDKIYKLKDMLNRMELTLMYISYYVIIMINVEFVCHIRIVKIFAILVVQKCM